MMFGFEIRNSSNRVQVSSEMEGYACIRSTVVNGQLNLSYREDDVISFTYLDGHYRNVYGGVGYTGANENIYAFGRHRMCVFRRTTLLSTLGGDFGLWVGRGNNSNTTFSSQWYPLTIVSSPSQTNYPSLMFQGGSLAWNVSFDLDGVTVYYYVTTPFIKLGNSNVSTQRSNVLTIKNNYYLWPRNIITNNVLIDVSKIPLEYSLG